LLLENLRIDGIDHEPKIRDHHGHIGAGWHRHLWNPVAGNSDSKECLSNFGQFDERRDFIRSACEVLGIELKMSGGEDYGTSGLLFSQRTDD
jgi:hypothetical protein